MEQCKYFDETENVKKSRISKDQRQAANARERARMSVLSQAFHNLRTVLPWVPSDTKLSKLDTLKLATNYIAHLSKIAEIGCGINYGSDGTSMVWPNSKFRCRKAGICQIDENCDCLERHRKKNKLTSSRKRKFEDNRPNQIIYTT
ncbi:hypothetical protein ACOME3_006137 [Neoechinorhynchus agilis]